MIFAILLFVTAFALSAVAAYYSIVGLIAIFPTAVIPIVTMGVTLEMAKLVCASWLYRNWKVSDVLMKYYFTTAVVILSFITSMGIFGFLSKAHIDQTTVGSTAIAELSVLEDQIKNERQKVENYQRSLTSLDKLVNDSDVKDAVFIRSRQAKERTQINLSIETSLATIKKLNEEALPLRKESKKIIAEVGPIKFIADLLFGNSADDTLEKAVRVVIILIVIVFDPLAIVLLIAANRELKITSKEPIEIIKTEKIDAVVLDEKAISGTKKKTKNEEIPKEILEKVFKK